MRSMTRGRKVTFAAGAAGVALLVAGLGAAGAIAASRVFSPSEESKAVIDDAAAQLGVQPKELSDALKQALKNRVDAAVDAGVLTKKQAQQLEARIDAGEYPFLFDLGVGFHHRGLGFGPHADFLAAAAAYLGMSEDELREALDGRTLSDIAKDKGKTVSGLVAALVAAEEKKIDEAVADGRITKAQASEITSALHDRMQALVEGDLQGRGGGAHPGLWPGSGFPRGPPAAFGGPRA
jgi:polyhydroxyalkanoate synthesis regulator phasin